jgi:hypothetical protein
VLPHRPIANIKGEAMKKLIILFFCLALITPLVGQTIYFVKEDGNDGNAGTNWATAFAALQKALDSADSLDQIWVAAGTYYPTSDFRMKNGVTIYGGFPSTGNPTMTGRDWETYETILSGKGGSVFYHPAGLGLDSTAVLDGLTITGGSACGSDPGVGKRYTKTMCKV